MYTYTVRYVPSWFPGAGFKRKADKWGKLLYSQILTPHTYVKNEIVCVQYAIYT